MVGLHKATLMGGPFLEPNCILGTITNEKEAHDSCSFVKVPIFLRVSRRIVAETPRIPLAKP